MVQKTLKGCWLHLYNPLILWDDLHHIFKATPHMLSSSHGILLKRWCNYKMINVSLTNAPTLQLFPLSAHPLTSVLSADSASHSTLVHFSSKSQTHFSSKTKITTYHMKVGDRRYRANGSKINYMGWCQKNMSTVLSKSQHLITWKWLLKVLQATFKKAGRWLFLSFLCSHIDRHGKHAWEFFQKRISLNLCNNILLFEKKSSFLLFLISFCG